MCAAGLGRHIAGPRQQYEAHLVALAVVQPRAEGAHARGAIGGRYRLPGTIDTFDARRCPPGTGDCGAHIARNNSLTEKPISTTPMARSNQCPMRRNFFRTLGLENSKLTSTNHSALTKHIHTP